MNYLVLDVETTGLDPLTDKLHGIGLVWPDGRSEYLTTPSAELRMWLRNPEANVVGHNIRFDIKFLIANGIEVRCKTWDTKLLAQLLNENQQLGLKPLSEKYFGTSSLDNKRELDRAVSSINGRSVADLCRHDLASSQYPNGEAPFLEIIAAYCIEDCINTKNLWEKLIADLKECDHKARNVLGLQKTPLDYYLDETMPLEEVLRSMELKGIRIDKDALVRYRVQVTNETNQLMEKMESLVKEEIDLIEEELYADAVSKKKSDKGKALVERSSEKHGTKFNWSSPADICNLIFEKLACPRSGVEKTSTGRMSTSEASLELVVQNLGQDSKAKQMLEHYAVWKKNLKLLSTYTGEDKGLLAQVVNGRVHSDYLQAGHGKESSQGGTVTGRLSSRNPNMQNLPRGSEVKRFFVPDPGQGFIYFDYSQLELRLAAHLSQDPLLIKAYREGLDLHQLTAKAIGEDRQMGKTVNFAMIYDASPWRLADILQRTPEECESVIANFFALYPGYAKYLRDEKTKMLQRGFVVSELGRVRRLPDLKTAKKFSREWRHAIKQGYNFPIQSLGASITKRAMIQLHKAGYQILTQVHDSVICQVPLENCKAELEKIVRIAEGIYPQCAVALKVDAKIITSLHESDLVKETNDEQHSDNRKDSTGNARSA